MATRQQHPIIPEAYLGLLDTTALAHIATLGPNGEPQNNPVWFDFDGERIKFSQTKTRQKYRNIQREPRIALSIVDPENPYKYLEIRGTVDQVDEDPNLEFINAMAKKYLGIEEYPYHQPGDERIVLYVRPEHTTQMGG